MLLSLLSGEVVASTSDANTGIEISIASGGGGNKQTNKNKLKKCCQPLCLYLLWQMSNIGPAKESDATAENSIKRNGENVFVCSFCRCSLMLIP